MSDFAALIENLNHSGISFICIKEEFDTSRPMGKAMMYIASVFAQLERETIAERVRDNMLMLARGGRWARAARRLRGMPPGKRRKSFWMARVKVFVFYRKILRKRIPFARSLRRIKNAAAYPPYAGF